MAVVVVHVTVAVTATHVCPSTEIVCKIAAIRVPIVVVVRRHELTRPSFGVRLLRLPPIHLPPTAVAVVEVTAVCLSDRPRVNGTHVVIKVGVVKH